MANSMMVLENKNYIFFVLHLTQAHWHGASPDSWFSHLAVDVPAEDASNEWLEAVDDIEYNKLN